MAGFQTNLMLTGPFLSRDDSKLNLGLNESAFAMPAAIHRRVLETFQVLHKYPLGEEPRVVERIAHYYGVTPESVTITRGIDEAEDRLIELFPSMRYIIFRPTFIGYEARFRLLGARYEVFTLGEDFAIRDEDWPRITRNDFVILANPNNPTGTMLSPEALARLRASCGKILLDEAYIDYSGRPSQLTSVDQDTFVFRSLSKSFALAGQRLGFLFGPEPEMASIKNRQWFCNVDRLSLELISAILEQPYMETFAAQIAAERVWLERELEARGFDVRPSLANFVVVRSPRASALAQEIASRGVVVMDTSVFALPGHVRITVGTRDQNLRLLDALHGLSP